MRSNILIGHIVFFSITIMFIFSCKKDNYTAPDIASLIVVNGIVGSSSVKIRGVTNTVANYGSSKVALRAGDFDLYIWPIGDSLNPYYTNPKFYTDNRGVYSLFLAGQSPNAIGILLKDELPFHTDSTCGIRFVNLCPNSPPLNITLSATPTVNQVSNLEYSQYTDFMLFPAKSSNSSYSIQIRKASDNTLLMPYSFSTPRFANVTLVIRGLVGSLGVTRINNDR